MKTKNKFYIIIGLVTLLLLMSATAYVTYKITLNRSNRITDDIKLKEVVKTNTVIKYVENPLNVDSLRTAIRNQMKKELEASYQEPEKNKDYDKQVDEYVEFLPDPIPIIEDIERISTTIYNFNDTFNKYNLVLKVSYHYPYKKEKPYFSFKPSKPIYEVKTTRKYDIMGFIGYNSLSVSFGYEPLSWLRVGTILNGQRVIVGGDEHIIINPLIGIGFKF